MASIESEVGHMTLQHNTTIEKQELTREQAEAAPALPPLRERLTKLVGAGYGPLLLTLIPHGVQYPRWNKSKKQYVPAVASGKSPGIWDGRAWAGLPSWTERRATVAGLEKMKDWPENTGIGLQTGTVGAFDIDIKVPPNSVDPYAVTARALISDIRNIIAARSNLPVERLPMRGRSNSTSVVFFARVDTLLKRRMMSFDADGHSHALEFLADGQQVVISGHHKSGGIQSSNLAEWPLEKLPLITEADVDELFAEFKAAGEAHGYQVDVSRTADRAPKGDRPRDLVFAEVMARKEDWLSELLNLDVSAALPFRLSQSDLDRKLDEDLLLDTASIWDFGTRRPHDPISLICEFGAIDAEGDIGFGGPPEYAPGEGQVYDVIENVFDTVRRPTPCEAATWLCRRIGGEAFPEYIGPTDWKSVSGAVATALGTSLQDLAFARVFEFVDWSTFDAQPEDWTENDVKRSASLVAALRIADPTGYERLKETWAQRSAEAIPVAAVEEALHQKQVEHVEREQKAHSAAMAGIQSVTSKLDPSTIPVREFVIEPRLPLGDVVQIAGEPGVSKSSFVLLDAVSIASGREDILRGKDGKRQERLHRKGAVIVYNAEDRLSDMQRRLTALQTHYGVEGACEPIVLWSGVDGRTLTIMQRGTEKNSILERASGADFLENMIMRYRPVLVCLDPQVSLTAGSQENSNDDINALYQELANMASKLWTCIQVIHHTSKSTREDAGDMGAGRGGFAAAGKARGVWTLTNATGKRDDEKQWNISAADNLIRLDSAKMNHAARPRTPTVFRRRSVAVGNGQGLPLATATALFEQSPRQMLEATGDFAPVLELVGLDELCQPAQAVEVDSEIARKIATAVDLVMGEADECKASGVVPTVGERLKMEGVTKAASRQELTPIITGALLGKGVAIEREGQIVRIIAIKSGRINNAPWMFRRLIESKQDG
ncbi:AAA family ATPase [Mesorhizobium sp. 8]|uniref:AAA family ATPase n=1 Tax=Mesorhizobium sp. 8 TaxID=2584466 RepID=UPI00111E2F69|nr:AAA family ATPase [Mesorhizobium sp. 8]QDC01714.1 AAA family ATPase [Mesorhizobium sp. 8]